MSAPSVTSSDLDLARQLSVQLSQATLKPREAAPNGALRYVRFAPHISTGLSPVPIAPHQPPPLSEPPRPAPTIEAPLSQNWADFLDWCLASCSADATFVVDAQGLVIANRGDIPLNLLEDAAAELTLGFAQCAVIGGSEPLRALTLCFERRQVFALCTASPEPAILGILGSTRTPEAIALTLLDCWPSVVTRLL